MINIDSENKLITTRTRRLGILPFQSQLNRYGSFFKKDIFYCSECGRPRRYVDGHYKEIKLKEEREHVNDIFKKNNDIFTHSPETCDFCYRFLEMVYRRYMHIPMKNEYRGQKQYIDNQTISALDCELYTGYYVKLWDAGFSISEWEAFCADQQYNLMTKKLKNTIY